MFENSKCHTFRKHWPKTIHKKFDKIKIFAVSVCIGDYYDWNKKTELSSFKTL